MALNTTPWNAVEGARAQLDAKRTALADRFDAAELAKAALANAQRTLTGSDLQPFINALSTAQGLLATARTEEGQARDALAAAIAAWAPTTLSADDDLKRLPANAPFVMFPIRIETRFGTTAPPNPVPALRLRVYPDEIFLDTHEPRLTREEIDAAKDYFNATDTIQEQPEHWRELLHEMTPERAAWVLRAMQPHDINGTGSLSITFFDPAPGYPPNPPHPGMRFPDPKKRPATWSKAGEAILPDRWVILLINGNVTRTVIGNPIPEPLAMTPDPSAAPEDMVSVPGSNDKIKIDKKILWTVDFAEAERVGMAKTIQLQGTEATTGFERVVVFGVKTSMRQEATSKYVEKLIDAHHYTRGVSVVPQGAPTNNTEDQPAGFSHEVDPAESFDIERNPMPSFADLHDYRLTPFDDGDYLARALGVPNGTFLNIRGGRTVPMFSNDERGTGREQRRAQAMADLLWELLFGHFGRELLDWNVTQRRQVRDWITNFVRARGPAPAIRIGTVPYGILPAVSIRRWTTRTITAAEGTTEQQRQALEALMVSPLRNLRERWKAAAIAQTPRVKPSSTDPSADLMRALALYPSMREARLRNVTGQTYAFHMVSFLGFDFTPVANRVSQAVTSVIQRLGVPQWLTRPISTLVFDAAAARFAGAMIAGAPRMSDTDALPAAENYLTILQAANITQLFANTVPVTGTNTTLFFRMLLHTMILETAQAMQDLIVGPPQLNMNVTINWDFHGVHASQLIAVKVNSSNPNLPVPTPRELLLQTISTDMRTKLQIPTSVPETTRIGDYVLSNKIGTLGNFLLNLTRLENVPTNELERLFTETMDTASHRLDAWLTGFATRRLYLMRARQTIDHAFPTGDFMGGWGYVENLRPAVRQTDPTTGLPIQVGNGGLIHAPSMAHASAAGVLRNGHLTHKDEAGQKCAVDLSSARARAAQLVLDELRAGQNLGAVLGYRIERRIQERAQLVLQGGNAAGAGAMEAYRLGLRTRFPLVVNKQAPNVTTPADGVAAARNVVDGLLLRNAFKAVPSQVNPATEIGGTQGPIVGPIIVEELNGLDNLVDGVADLVTSESIMQFVRGNVGRTAGTLDALARGGRPPEAEMVRSSTRGPSLTFPVGLVLNGDTPAGDWPAPGGTSPATPATYRAEADAALDKWAGSLIGDPSKVVCQVTIKKTDGTSEVRPVTLAALAYREARDATGTPTARKLRPLDVVALGRATSQPNQGSLLDRWITTVATTGVGEQVTLIDYARVGTNQTFAEAMEIALTVGQLLGGARPLRPEDLVFPGELGSRRDELAQAAAAGADALAGKANAAAAFLDNAITRLEGAADATARRIALENASAFVASAYPSSVMTDDILTAMADATQADLERRQADLEANPSLPVGSTPSAIVERALTRLKIIFGQETMATFQFTSPNGAELSRSFTAIAAAMTPAERDEPIRFLQGAAEVRDPLRRWRRMELYIRALKRARPRLDVAQLPSVPGERWIGLPFDTTAGQPPPPPNGFSPLLYSYGTAAPDPAQSWAGLLLDAWTEIVPRDSEETGIAFHYDSPGAEAPQAILVVPPSSVGQPCPNDNTIDGWQAADMIATLNETIDLAKIRTVDAQMVDFGQLFPSIYLTENVGGNVATTNWLGSLFARLAIPRT
jgi:hypothetical protein